MDISLPSPFDHIDAILQASENRRPALFLDYDGTLTPIVADPKDACLSGSMRAILRTLADRCKLAIISGRDLADVRERVGLADIYYAGSHGFEIAGPKGRRAAHQVGASHLEALDQAERQLRVKLASIQGSDVERKRFSVAVHIRRVDARDLAFVEHAVPAARDTCTGLRLAYEKKVYELQPDIDWNKGKALEWIVGALELDSGRDTFIYIGIYIGDDASDETAFRRHAAPAPHGAGIVVAETMRPTAAGYRLSDSQAVERFLRELAARLPAK